MNAADFRFYRQVNKNDNILVVAKEDIETFYMVQDFVKNEDGELEEMDDFDVICENGQRLRFADGYNVEYCEADTYFNSEGEEETPREACYATMRGVIHSTNNGLRLVALENDPYYPFTSDDYKEVELEILEEGIEETEYSDIEGSYELIKVKVDGKETFAIVRHVSAYAGDYFDEICEISESLADTIQEEGFEDLEMSEYFN